MRKRVRKAIDYLAESHLPPELIIAIIRKAIWEGKL